MTLGAEERLAEAVKQLKLARRDVRRPDQDSALAKAEYLAGGVLRDLEEDDSGDDDGGIDPSLVTDGGSNETFGIQVRGEEAIEALENALEAAAAEQDAELNSGPGHPAADEITTSDALVELARAYTGWPAENGEGGSSG